MDSIGSYGSSAYTDYTKMRQEMFSKIDSDDDGQVSLEEFEAAKPEDAPVNGPSSSELFSSMDSDEDGYLSSDEMAAAPPPPPPPSGGAGGPSMMEDETLSALLQALEESTSDTSSSTDINDLLSQLSATQEESETSKTDEEGIMEMIQQEVENYRNSAFSQASDAYTDAGRLSSLMSSQQQLLASL